MDQQAFQLLMAKLEDHDKKLEQLLAWRYKLAGATLAVTALGTVIMQIIFKVMV